MAQSRPQILIRPHVRSGSFASRLRCPLSRRLSSTPDIARPTKTRLLVGFLRPICKPLAHCANHDSASDLAAIADTSALLKSPLRILA